MRTKFVLHGGFKPGLKQEDDLFFKEILESTKDNSKVLLVYFAKKEIGSMSANKQEDIFQFEKNSDGKKLSFEMADEGLFTKQIVRSDIIYLHGGNSLKLLDILSKIKNIKELFEGRIIAADSAGVNSLSTYFYSQSTNSIVEGIGLIPFKTICHYSQVYKDKFEVFSKKNKVSKLLLLSEYQTKVFEL